MLAFIRCPLTRGGSQRSRSEERKANGHHRLIVNLILLLAFMGCAVNIAKTTCLDSFQAGLDLVLPAAPAEGAWAKNPLPPMALPKLTHLQLMRSSRRDKGSIEELEDRSQHECEAQEGYSYVRDTVLDPHLAFADGRRIPRVVHVTSKSRCLQTIIADGLDLWRFPDHSFFFHDDVSMHYLLFEKHWPELPQLQKILRCLKHVKVGAALADIWRLLVIYEYGGIYTDIDNIPAKLNGTTIQVDDDAYFQVDIISLPSQWFFAAAPRHPILYLAVLAVCENMQNTEVYVKDIGDINVVWTTGPGALTAGFRRFTGINYGNELIEGVYSGRNSQTGGGYFRQSRLVGTKQNESEWVQRAYLSFEQKKKLYNQMGMTQMIQLGENITLYNQTCQEHMFLEDNQDLEHFEPVLW